MPPPPYAHVFCLIASIKRIYLLLCKTVSVQGIMARDEYFFEGPRNKITTFLHALIVIKMFGAFLLQ